MFYPDSARVATDANLEFSIKRALTKETGVPDVTMQRNRYPFFQSFKNHVSPLGKIGIEITLENDDDLIFRDATVVDAGRVVVTSMMLWVPKLEFNDIGKKWYFNHISSKPT